MPPLTTWDPLASPLFSWDLSEVPLALCLGAKLSGAKLSYNYFVSSSFIMYLFLYKNTKWYFYNVVGKGRRLSNFNLLIYKLHSWYWLILIKSQIVSFKDGVMTLFPKAKLILALQYSPSYPPPFWVASYAPIRCYLETERTFQTHKDSQEVVHWRNTRNAQGHWCDK